jgi:hypothetical protein
MEYFYHNMIKKYLLAVTYIFKDIHVKKYDSDRLLQKDFRVPITYAPKTKLIAYLNNTQSEEVAGIAQLVPRIGINDLAPEYAGQRKRQDALYYTSNDKVYDMPEGVPYDIPYEVSIITRSKDDMNQILEQVLTIFTPDVVVSVNEIPELDLTSDISILLETVAYENVNEFAEEDYGRELVATISLRLRGSFYPRISDAGLIEAIKINMKKLENDFFYEQIAIDYQSIVTINDTEL